MGQKIAAAVGAEVDFVTWPSERMPAHLLQPGNSVQHWTVDSSRIRQELGYQELVSLAEGLRQTIEWERAHPPGALNSYEFDYTAEDAAITVA